MLSTNSKNKIVWITGASSGIGEALTYAYAKSGATVVISARRVEELNRVKNNCGENAARIFTVPLDLANLGDVTYIYKEFKKMAGGAPDILINNGGMGHLGDALLMQERIERQVMEVNFWGHVALTKAVLPDMLARKSGSIVAISSILGHFGSPGLAAYAASKHAVLGYFESLREELIGTGVNVALVAPGFINTNVTKASLTATGEVYGQNSVAQEKGMSPEIFAEKLITKIEKKKNYIFIGRSEIFAVPFKHFAPNLFFAVMRYLTKRARKGK